MTAIAYSIGFGVALTLAVAIAEYQLGKQKAAIWWGLACWILAGAGLANTLLARSEHRLTPNASTENTGANVLVSGLEAQTAAQLRPFLSVSAIEMHNFQVGNELTVIVRFQNDGRAPASDVKAVGKLDIAPIGAFVDMRYDGLDVGGSTGTIGSGKAMEIVLFGPPAMSRKIFAGLHKGMHQMVAHGRVTYRSQYIMGSGQDEMRFCHQFDPETRGMVACRPLLSQSDEKKK